MSSADPLSDIERVASEGLDHVFSHTVQEPCHDEQERSEEDAGELVDEADGLSVAQTAVLIGFDQRAVVKLIKERKLCGKRIRGTRNWVVELECVQAWLQKLGFGSGKKDLKDEIEAPENHEIALAGQAEDGDHVKTLWYKLEMSGQQLRAASYRIGYLESQVEVFKQQVALLPDLQSSAGRLSEAESECDELKMKLAGAQAELERMRLPWWQRWFTCQPESGASPKSE
jgi:hypothetical protein